MATMGGFAEAQRHPNGIKVVPQMLENIGAGEGNRTLVFSLEGCYSTIELHPRQFSAPARKARSARLRSYKQMALPVKAGAALRFCARRAKIAHQFWVRKRDDSR